VPDDNGAVRAAKNFTAGTGVDFNMKQGKKNTSGFMKCLLPGRGALKVEFARVLCCEDRDTPCESKFKVTVTNTGSTPVEIAEVGIGGFPVRKPPGGKAVPLGQTLMPSESAVVYFDARDMRGLDRYDVFYAKDGAGKVYYPGVNIWERICRFWWLRFGRTDGTVR